MDREISAIEQNKTKVQQYFKVGLFLLTIAVAFYLFRSVLTTTIQTSDFKVVQVERGTIENTISAMGIVVPSFEQQINAPINTEIKKVVLKNGSTVQKGATILELDQQYIQLEYDGLNDQLELRKNKITRLKLEYEKNLKDVGYENEIKGLELSSLQTTYKDAQHLLDIGGASKMEVEKASFNVQIAAIEKQQLENNLHFLNSVIEGDRRNLELEVMMQEKKLKELSKKLNQTTVKAPAAGVITWVNENIGRKVNEGEALVRMANLESFRVEASCSDRYANRLNVGQTVHVKINKVKLNGTINAILPAVENNTIEFIVELENANFKDLRPNMKVEVFIISDKKEDVLRVANGGAFTGATRQELFVLNGEQAIKTSVKVGLSNSDFVEIVDGELTEGDRIIVSDMKKYKHLDRIVLNN